ncbi:transketolase C-terminal domain-containing protein [Streptomyces sp. NPDC048409]|uniref:alpha-ketoacid dehydrogenase subunit beta n=1 Tax=Streptomyces sp. NPDC048409 TaxID=3154723 RepID=UPI0034363CAB
MTRRERVAENLNRALHTLLDTDPAAYVLGEDIADPYGGAFKVTRGLSERHPERVISTPLSESGITGVGAGLALAGNRPVVEMMFADFASLAFDQLLNFASKSVSMYGRRIPLSMVVRCPTGGNRGYGPTHSQSIQKHFIGIPDLSLYETTPFHDNEDVFAAMLGREQPCVLFEDKVLYTRPLFTDGVVDDLFHYEMVGDDNPTAHLRPVDDADPDWIVVAPGGLAERVIEAMRSLLLEEELSCELLVPSRLYPFDLSELLPTLTRARGICVVEDGAAGGTWGEVLAQQLHTRLWGRLDRPVLLLSAEPSIIPTAAHLEREVVLQSATIHRAIAEATK